MYIICYICMYYIYIYIYIYYTSARSSAVDLRGKDFTIRVVGSAEA